MTISHLYRFPIKGLSEETPDSFSLVAGDGLPGDRELAIARTSDLFDPASPQALSKTNFLMLMKDEKLARLQSRFDAPSRQLVVSENGVTHLEIGIDSEEGRAKLASFFRDFLASSDLDPTIVAAPGHKFTDLSVVSPEKMRAISLINTKSVEAFAADLGQQVDHRRFRGNIVFDGKAPWEEFDWLGKIIRIGTATARVVKRTQRCAATEVNPDTAERDIRLPFELRTRYGHMDMGIYAEVETSGDVKVGDHIEVIG